MLQLTGYVEIQLLHVLNGKQPAVTLCSIAATLGHLKLYMAVPALCIAPDSLFLWAFFFRCLSPRPLGQSSPHFATCSVVIQIYKCKSQILGAPPQKFGGLKHQHFGEISDNFASWSQISLEYYKTSSTGKRRCKLCSLPHMLVSLVNFGLQIAKK